MPGLSIPDPKNYPRLVVIFPFRRSGNAGNATSGPKLNPQSAGADGASIFCLSPSGEFPQPTTTRDIMITLTTQSNFFIRSSSCKSFKAYS